jgi:hypothetical protein
MVTSSEWVVVERCHRGIVQITAPIANSNVVWWWLWRSSKRVIHIPETSRRGNGGNVGGGKGLAVGNIFGPELGALVYL